MRIYNSSMLTKQFLRYKRHKRIRKKIKGTPKRPRLSVFRSNKHIYLQLIDDEKGKILVSASDAEIKTKKNLPVGKQGSKKIDLAYKVGELIAQKAAEKKIKEVVFSRGGYKYHGRVKATAEGARKGGLIF